MMAAICRLPQSSLVLRLVGIAIGLVLASASWDKITQPDRFADIVHDYDMLPLFAVNAFALLMPWTELVTGSALILFGLIPGAPAWRRGAGMLSTFLFLAFLIAIAQAELRGLRIECGCFDVSGFAESEASWSLFLRDLPMFLVSALVWRRG
jgi:hypothetical protein